MGDSSDLIHAFQEIWPLLRTASSVLNAYRMKRLESLVARLNQVDSDDFRQFLVSEKGFQILETIAERVWREHREQKRERYANLIVSSWIDEQSGGFTLDEAAFFAEAIDAFSDAHIAILQKLYDERSCGTVGYKDLGAFDSEQKQIAVDALCSRFGMVRRAWDLERPEVKGAILFSGNLSPEGIARKCFHKITPLGERFMEHILSSDSTGALAIDKATRSAPSGLEQ